MNNNEVFRDPVDPQKTRQEIEDVFTFNAPHSKEHYASCQKIQTACKNLAQALIDEVPEGKEQTVAINNLLSAALFARHGITRRQVLMVSVAAPSEPPVPVEGKNAGT